MEIFLPLRPLLHLGTSLYLNKDSLKIAGDPPIITGDYIEILRHIEVENPLCKTYIRYVKEIWRSRYCHRRFFVYLLDFIIQQKFELLNDFPRLLRSILKTLEDTLDMLKIEVKPSSLISEDDNATVFKTKGYGLI